MGIWKEELTLDLYLSEVLPRTHSITRHESSLSDRFERWQCWTFEWSCLIQLPTSLWLNFSIIRPLSSSMGPYYGLMWHGGYGASLSSHCHGQMSQTHYYIGYHLWIRYVYCPGIKAVVSLQVQDIHTISWRIPTSYSNSDSKTIDRFTGIIHSIF